MSTRSVRVALLIASGVLAACASQDGDKIEETTPDSAICEPSRYPGYMPPSRECTCQPSWTYAGKTYCNATCGNPDGDPNGPWCFTTATCLSVNWSYCQLTAVPSCEAQQYPDWTPSTAGCTCATVWTYKGKTYCNGICGNPDDDPLGPWCITTGTCNGQNWDRCKAPAP